MAKAAAGGQPARQDEGALARLERLSALHAGGSLTSHEFVAAKQRVLGMDGDSAVAAHRLAHAPLHGEDHAIDQDAHYLFDLNGFLVVKGVLTPEEVRAGNEAIDLFHGRVRVPPKGSTARDAAGMAGKRGRGNMGGLLSLPEPHRRAFTNLVAHPKIVPYLNEIVGKGFRMDHAPALLTMTEGTEGHILHGSSGPEFDPFQYYVHKNGHMHAGLTVVAFQFAPQRAGDGGLALIPGSHKCNVPCPRRMARYEAHTEFVHQVVAEAGDAVIFCEATTHGTLPWRAAHERRAVLTRYCPPSMAYMGPGDSGYGGAYAWPEQVLAGLTPEQRAVMEPPYHVRLRRPIIADSGRLMTDKEAKVLHSFDWLKVRHSPSRL